jgi:hypothetical protein
MMSIPHSHQRKRCGAMPTVLARRLRRGIVTPLEARRLTDRVDQIMGLMTRIVSILKASCAARSRQLNANPFGR